MDNYYSTDPISLNISLHDEKYKLGNDLLGSISIPLCEELHLNLLEGNSSTAWYNIANKSPGYSKTPKLRISISYLLKSKLDEFRSENSSLIVNKSANDSQSSINCDNHNVFGINRGKCNILDCDCHLYQSETNQGGLCQNCGHWPTQHQNLSEPNDTKVEKSKSPEIEKKSSPKKKLVEQPEDDDKNINSHVPFSWEIDPSEITIGELIGSGTFAKVYKGTYRSQEVAIKTLKAKESDKIITEFNQEFKIMRFVLTFYNFLIFSFHF